MPAYIRRFALNIAQCVWWWGSLRTPLEFTALLRLPTGLRGKEGMEKDGAIPLLLDFLPKHPG